MSYYDDDDAVKSVMFFFYVIVIIFFLAISLWRPIDKVRDIRYETVEVTDKMVKDDKYLVYSTGTTYEITDSWLYGRFNSSDLYGKIEVGKTYKMKIGGSRKPFFSWYPNIYEITEVKGG